MKTNPHKHKTFVQLKYELQDAREARNYAIMLGLDHLSHSRLMHSINDEIERRIRGQANIDKFYNRYPNRSKQS